MRRFAFPGRRAFSRSLRRFAGDEGGVITVESLLVLPLYLFWFVTTFQLFQIFRLAGINEKAAYTISDIISRENGANAINQAYVNGVHSLYNYLLANRGETWVRVTLVGYDAVLDQYETVWSVATTGMEKREGDLSYLRNRLPVMPASETVILVETLNDTRLSLPFPFSAMETFIVTRPRFLTSLPGG
jgi:hypothetical protein